MVLIHISPMTNLVDHFFTCFLVIWIFSFIKYLFKSFIYFSLELFNFFLTDYLYEFFVYSWRRKWQPIPVFLPGKSHGQRNLADLSPWGRTESNMTERLTLSFFLYILDMRILSDISNTNTFFRFVACHLTLQMMSHE